MKKPARSAGVLGSPGGGRIGSTVIEILVNLIDFKMDLKKAVETPKFAGYDYYKEIRLEDTYPEKTLEFLQKIYGHKVKVYSYPDLYFRRPQQHRGGSGRHLLRHGYGAPPWRSRLPGQVGAAAFS